MVRRVAEMERLPRGYAVAWWNDHERVGIALPIGLHVVASWLRSKWHGFMAWRTPSVLERAYMRGYRAGQEGNHRAYVEGVKEGRRQVEREFSGLEAAIRKEVIEALLEELRQPIDMS